MTYILKEILNLRSREKMTYQKIADIVGLTRSRIQQIIKKEAPRLSGHGYIKRKSWAKMKTITCKTCGKKFQKYQSVIRNSKYPIRYCSRKCYR